MPKKKKKIRITVSDKHRKAMQWCLNNNITVGILPTTRGLKIEINDNGKTKKSPKIYDQEEAQRKCWELYLYFYDKHWEIK
tara:strand:- start:869 stop:1111 length:243 start_codon:yes stop_codon:yes gene_type:complete